MAITFIDARGAGSSDTLIVSTTPGTTVGAGIDLFVVGVASYDSATEPTLSDTYNNTWTPLNAYSAGGLPRVRMHYCVNPTLGANHVFTVDGGATASYPSIGVIMFSGIASSPFDLQNGGSSVVSTTVLTGSTGTPSEDNELIVTTLAAQANFVSQDLSGSTNIVIGFSAGVHWELAMTFQIQTTATARNVTWTVDSTVANAASIATFKAAAAATGKPWYPYHMIGH